MRRALLLAAAGIAVVPDVSAAATQPADESGRSGGASPPGGRGSPSAGPTTGNAALDAAYGYPPSGGAGNDQPAPQGTFDPGYTESRGQRAADRAYGSTAVTIDPNGNVVSGMQITDYSGLQEPGWQRPEYHTVQRGDTLWDISGTYLSDPYLWPKLWSWNDHVTNAHWIFPGDRIRLSDPYTTGDLPTGPSLRFSKTRLPRGVEPRPYLLNQHAFVDAAEFDTAMTVTGGAEPNVMMSTLDTVYMSYDKGHPPIPGERLVVYAPQNPVFDIENKNIIGYLVEIMGDVEVESIAREAAEGTVAAALNPVERGYKVGPLRRRFRRVDPIEAEKSMVGQIVATLNDTGPINVEEPWSAKSFEKQEKKRQRRERRKRRTKNYVLAGEKQFVIVDLGEGDGIEVGNVLEVVRKGDGYTDKRVFDLPYEDGWPRQVVATLLVVQVQPQTALAVTTWSSREIERTDHVELRGRDLDRGGPSDSGGDDPNSLDANGDAQVESGDGKAKASGGFRLGG
jgi:hypothetical protein